MCCWNSITPSVVGRRRAAGPIRRRQAGWARLSCSFADRRRPVWLTVRWLLAAALLGALAGCAPPPPERVFAAAQTTGEQSELRPPTRVEGGIVYAWAPCPSFADDWRMGIVPLGETDRFPNGETPVFVVAHLLRRAGQLVKFVYRAADGQICRQAGVQNTLRHRSVYLADRFVPAEEPGFLPGAEYTVEVTCAGELLGTTTFRVE
jgi:hypothetical protein